MLLAPCACRPAGNPDPKKAEKESGNLWRRVGTELAQLVSRKHPDATRVLLIRQEIRPELDLGPAQDQMEEAVRSRLSKLGRSGAEVIVHALPAVAPPAPGEEMNFSPYRSLDSGTLSEIVKKHGRVSVVISLLGEPVGRTAPDSWPPLVCFSRNGSTNLAGLIRSGVVSGAVAPLRSEPPRDADGWFELRYKVLDRESIDTW